MTKQKHVKEPWVFQNLPQGILIQNDNSEIADVIWEADAKRIVECVNACTGIESPLDLRRQRDELREALEKVTDLYVSLANSGDAGNWNPEAKAEVILARSALAKIKESV